jgi:hypothetical protein
LTPRTGTVVNGLNAANRDAAHAAERVGPPTRHGAAVVHEERTVDQIRADWIQTIGFMDPCSGSSADYQPRLALPWPIVI